MRARLCVVLLVVFSMPMFAQRRGTRTDAPSAAGRGGTNIPTSDRGDVVVRIVGLDERSITDQPFQVQLLKNGVPLATAFSDNSGSARFNGVTAGSYVAVVSGSGYEDASVSLEFIAGDHSETVHMKPVSGGAAHVTSKQPTVSLSDLKAPDNAKKELDKGNAAMQRKEFPKAIAHFRKAVDIYPGFVSALNNLAAACVAVDDWACGRDALEKALAIDANAQRAAVNLARVDMHDKNYAEAEKLLDKAIAADPLNPEALTMLSMSELMQGQYDDALANARKVHSVAHRGWGFAHLIAAQALEAKRLPNEALAEYDLFVKEAPDNPYVPKAREAMARLAPAADSQH